ncbi:MAG: hypothetical protein CMJ75_06600 [Planctomycetaceae bacterium]|nr:hypothetical protein [Planctomycetaceae bacterium]
MDRYLSKISGPLLDRIDIQIEVAVLSFDELTSQAGGTSSSEMCTRGADHRRPGGRVPPPSRTPQGSDSMSHPGSPTLASDFPVSSDRLADKATRILEILI